jgi:hypothetical protein
MQAQAAVLHAVKDHPSLAPAHKLTIVSVRINWSKMQAAYKFVCKQSSCLMEHNHNLENLRTNITAKKRDAAKVILTFRAPLPEKVTTVIVHVCLACHRAPWPQGKGPHQEALAAVCWQEGHFLGAR